MPLENAPDWWSFETAHDGDSWNVIVEPDERDRVIVVITAYRVTS